MDVPADPAPEPPVVVLREPPDGVPPVLATQAEITEAARRLAAGDGPVAVDAERASGYRYFQRAYLIQLRRAGAGTVLIDPTGGADLRAVNDALADAEWVLHAAKGDLACLAEVGLTPPRLFDTELAGRLAGFPRVSLGTLAESLLGVHLEKAHSAADWSRRPLPAGWLAYAALDVELLVALRDTLEAELARQGKLGWAQAEFEALRCAPAPEPRAEPWRRIKGLHVLRERRQLAVARELWATRDTLARERDRAPGRLLPDSALIAAAAAGPRTVAELRALPVFSGPRMRRMSEVWLAAIARGGAVSDADLPSRRPRAIDGHPSAAGIISRDPVAAARLLRARTALEALARSHGLPVENLLDPASVRQLCAAPPEPLDTASVTGALAELGAREWQVELSAGVLAGALASPAPDHAGQDPTTATGVDGVADDVAAATGD